jgi:hypothetical protein
MAEIAHIDGDDHVAFHANDIADRLRRVTALAQQIGCDQTLFGAEFRRYEREFDVVSGRRGAVNGFEFTQ